MRLIRLVVLPILACILIWIMVLIAHATLGGGRGTALFPVW